MKPGDHLRVLDTEENRANAFWRPFVGKTVLFVHTEPDGSFTVFDETMVIPTVGVNASRFELVTAPVETVYLPIPRWRRFGRALGRLIDRIV